MKRIYIYLLFLSLLSSIDLRAQQSVDDFFPLSIGNSWTYNYSASDDEELGEYRTTDSGVATYRVVSQSLSPDSIIWNIQEIRDIVHHYNFYFPPQVDTSYAVHDTTTFPIVEYQSNNHQLISWATNWETVFYFRSQLADSNSLFRYYPSQMRDTFTVVESFMYQGHPIEVYKASFQRHTGLTMASYTAPGVAGDVPVSHHTLKSFSLTAVKSNEPTSLPTKFVLEHNFPNPFNPGTSIVFDNPKAMKLKMSIYDVLGRLVATILNDEIQPGTHSIQWNASNYSSGIYFCVAQTEGQIYSIRLVLLK